MILRHAEKRIAIRHDRWTYAAVLLIQPRLQSLLVAAVTGALAARAR